MKFIKRLDLSYPKEGIAAVALKAGQVVSHDLDRNNELVPALANGQLWKIAGVATHDCNASGVVTICYEGQVQYAPGTFEAGFVYVASADVPGELVKHDDMGSVGYLALVGYAISDSVLELLNIQRRSPAIRVEKVVVAPTVKNAKG